VSIKWPQFWKFSNHLWFLYFVLNFIVFFKLLHDSFSCLLLIFQNTFLKRLKRKSVIFTSGDFISQNSYYLVPHFFLIICQTQNDFKFWFSKNFNVASFCLFTWIYFCITHYIFCLNRKNTKKITTTI
jgi:hypothetical protein